MTTQDPGLTKNTLTLREHRDRIARQGLRPLSMEEIEVIHPAEADAFAVQIAIDKTTGADQTAIAVIASGGETVIKDAGTVILVLPFETTDQTVITAAVLGVHAGIDLVAKATAEAAEKS